MVTSKRRLDANEPRINIHCFALNSFFENCDGVMLSSPEALESAAINSAKEWFSETGKDVYSVGPLLPRSYWSATQSDQGAVDVTLFLKEMQEKYGQNSVFLVRKTPCFITHSLQIETHL